jgi:hypothetical protein
MTWSVTLTSDGHRNVSVLVKGQIKPTNDLKTIVLFDVEGMSPKPRGLKLTGAWWLIEEKGAIQLWWGKEAIPHQTLIVPLESRGVFQRDEGLASPKEWDGLITMTYSAPTARLFTLILDFDKL